MTGPVISGLEARMILDSRADPTVEVDCYVEGRLAGRAAVPSGASTGQHEAVELRDDDLTRWVGKGVERALEHVVDDIQAAVVGLPVRDQRLIDETMIDLDDTPNKATLGANAMLGTSLACVHAASSVHQLPLWRYIGGVAGGVMPVPLMNVLNGGAHADGDTDIQEFMVVPHGFDTFPEALRAGVECYHALKSVLKDRGLPSNVGDEGGFAPSLSANAGGLDLLMEAIGRAGYDPDDEVAIALDVAATEFHDAGTGTYEMEGRSLGSEELSQLYSEWLDQYPIVSIEDGFAEDDWSAWVAFQRREGDRVQTVGDDLYATNSERLAEGIERSASNAILVKLNQVGTVSETLDCVALARASGLGTVISHRSGETEDASIADLAVGLSAGQIKTGAPARSDRTAKYNQLLRIAEDCPDFAQPF